MARIGPHSLNVVLHDKEGAPLTTRSIPLDRSSLLTKLPVLWPARKTSDNFSQIVSSQVQIAIALIGINHAHQTMAPREQHSIICA